MAISEIFSKFIEWPDVAKGLLFGVGFGLLVLAIISNKFKTTQ